ncbi:MAG: hypothetical protein IKQ97_10330 [Eubacterium sp.]|nr:hypothetical protein [Eubacterium sp.]
MNRLKRIGGSIVLAAALVVSSIGVSPAETPALAAETTMTPEEFGTAMKAVGAKISEIAKSQTLKTTVSGSSAGINFEMTMDVDATSKVGHSTMPSFVELFDEESAKEIFLGTKKLSSVDLYMDLDKNLLYVRPEGSQMNLVSAFPGASYLQGFGVGESEGNMFTSMITPEVLKLFEGHVTITANETVWNGVPSKKLSLKINYAKGEIAALISEMMKAMPEGMSSMFGGNMGGSTGGFDFNSMIKDMACSGSVDFIVAAADYTPLEMDFGMKMEGMKFGGMEIPMDMNAVITFAVSSEKLAIPADRITDLVLSPGAMAEKGGVSFVSSMDDKGGAFFMLFEVTNAKAKKITIPASLTECGVTTKIDALAPGAFEKAKNLKTIIVKSPALKKMLKKIVKDKKLCKKYGLKYNKKKSKQVKIK